MTTAASAQTDNFASSTWRTSAPHVRKALAFVKRKGSVTAEELVQWDGSHGRKLFDWDDPAAAEEWRRQQARCFLNRFRRVFEGMRVRAYIHIHEDTDAGIEASEYVNIESITQHPGMRAQVIADITGRMRMLARELKLWKLSHQEQAELFQRLAEAMTEQKTAEAA